MAERPKEPIKELSSTIPPPRRILSLEIRLSKIGFVVFEDSNLIDWGVKIFSGQTSLCASSTSQAVWHLLALYRPGTVVVRERNYVEIQRNNRSRVIFSSVRHTAKLGEADFVMIAITRVKRHFCARGCDTKQQIAAHVARSFEPLSWKLPKPRKVYQSEPPLMLVFDAAATGSVFIEEQAMKLRAANSDGRFDGLSPT